jgi:hypothetical protein
LVFRHRLTNSSRGPSCYGRNRPVRRCPDRQRPAPVREIQPRSASLRSCPRTGSTFAGVVSPPSATGTSLAITGRPNWPRAP